jgi:lambda repressor-like predicted transcriptional regulator
LLHLESLLKLAPDDAAAADRLVDLRYDAYIARTAPVAADNDPEGDWLLAQLRRRLRPPASYRECEERQTARQLLLRSALISLRRGDLQQRARDLFEITELDPNEPGALYLYGLSLRDLAGTAKTPKEAQEFSRRLEQLLQVAHHRMEQRRFADLLGEEDAALWADRFHSLRLP